jgi:hypothetical protein
MYRFRLSSATIAVIDGSRDLAVLIPAGAEVLSANRIDDVTDGFERSRFIRVDWDGKVVRMFLLDLLERGQEVSSC